MSKLPIAVVLLVSFVISSLTDTSLETPSHGKEEMHMLEYSGRANAPEFPSGMEWLNTDGPLSIRQLRGKVVLLFFGYTQCPDVCPTTLATWRKIHEALDGDADQVRFAFVTVDPERDTPERLGLHVHADEPLVRSAATKR